MNADFPKLTVATGNSIIGGLSSNNGENIQKMFPVLFNGLQKEDVSPEEIATITARIEKGQELVSTLLDINQSLPSSSREAALNITWFFMACGYQENKDVFHRGSVRLYNLSEDQTIRLKTFYGSCKEANAHNRISSHFKELTIGHQKGLDFEKGELPFDKQLSTLLCGRLKDGGFFIKLEREPLSLTNVAGTVKHCWNFIQHKLSGGGEQIVGGKSTCRETDNTKEPRMHAKNIRSLWKELSKEAPLIENSISSEKTQSTWSLSSNEGEKVPRRLNQMYKMVNEIRQKSFALTNNDPSALTSENINAHNTEEFKAKFSKLSSSLDSFYESTSSIQHPEIACGGEACVDLAQYTKP